MLDADEALAVCCEIADVPLQNIAAMLSDQRSDFLQAASRLHTRSDVDWPALDAWVGSS